MIERPIEPLERLLEGVVRRVRLQADHAGNGTCGNAIMQTNRPEHLHGFDYLGLHRYFLTFCTDQRHRAFESSERVDLARTQILRAAGDEQIEVTAYCFMPDHLHMLVEGLEERADCRRFIKRAKQFSGFYSKKQFGRTLWQRYGYERTLRDEDDTLGVARYIIENPLRAGLVEDVSKYPFLGSSRYSIQQILEAVQWANPCRSA